MSPHVGCSWTIPLQIFPAMSCWFQAGHELELTTWWQLPHQKTSHIINFAAYAQFIAISIKAIRDTKVHRDIYTPHNTAWHQPQICIFACFYRSWSERSSPVLRRSSNQFSFHSATQSNQKSPSNQIKTLTRVARISFCSTTKNTSVSCRLQYVIAISRDVLQDHIQGTSNLIRIHNYTSLLKLCTLRALIQGRIWDYARLP